MHASAPALVCESRLSVRSTVRCVLRLVFLLTLESKARSRHARGNSRTCALALALVRELRLVLLTSASESLSEA